MFPVSTQHGFALIFACRFISRFAVLFPSFSVERDRDRSIARIGEKNCGFSGENPVQNLAERHRISFCVFCFFFFSPLPHRGNVCCAPSGIFTRRHRKLWSAGRLVHGLYMRKLAKGLAEGMPPSPRESDPPRLRLRISFLHARARIYF